MAADQVPVSNRKGTAPFFGGRRFNVDKVSVSFPVARCAPLKDWPRLSASNRSDGIEWTRSASVEVGQGVKAMIGVSDIRSTGQQWAKVELNPSRVLDPDGWSAMAGARETLDAIDTAISAAMHEGYFDPAIGSVEDVNLKRLDVCRDIHGVSDAPGLIGGLIGVHRSHSRQARVFYDTDRAGAQTLVVGGKRNQVRLYDKATETEGAAADVVRWEALCRSDWLGNYGDMRKAGDMSDELIEQLGLERFDWSGMGRDVASSVALVAERVNLLDVSASVKRSLIGYLVQQSLGVPQKLSNDSASKYRKLAKSAGVAMALDGMESAEAGFTVRLDVDLGQAVYACG